jgi:outer membrane protein OmpA-like peptidoglycan-associated protein
VKNVSAALALAALIALAACSGGSQGSAGATPSPATSAETSNAAGASSAAPAATDTPPPTAEPGATATPEPTPTPNANLLSGENGARLLSYPAGLGNLPDDVVADGPSIQPSAPPGPYVFLYELPTVESIDTITGRMSEIAKGDPARTVIVAFSTTARDAGFNDVGKISAGADNTPQTIQVNAKARWVKVTFDSPGGTGWNGISATGTIPPRTGPPISGMFIEQKNPYLNGADNGSDESKDPWYLRAVSVGDGLTLMRCYSGRIGDSLVGTLIGGRTYLFGFNTEHGRLVVNDEGTELIGKMDGDWIHEVATKTMPAKCVPDKPYGTGPDHILVLDNENVNQPYPLNIDPKLQKSYRFTRIEASLVDPSWLANEDMVVLNGECKSSEFLSPAQGSMLVDWVGAGHKLAIYNADMCSDVTSYDFLPYQFHTSNPGARGAHGDRLIEVESDDLGSLDKTDTKHYVDASAYAANVQNQLGDANTVTTMDDHWCGHLFGTNANDVNGFMEMYALYGKGVFIFGGFDEDDSGIVQYQKVRDLELGLSLPADLGCSVKVDLSMILEPDREGTFVPGKAAIKPFAMEVLANQGWKGHVDITTQGQFPTSVTPSSFDMAGGTRPLALSVNIPANTHAGTYAVTVIATDQNGKTSQAVIQFNGEVPLKKISKKQKRIRLYGIHFDTDSARIQPRSEPVIKEIADLMNGDKTLRFQVEGHTDSDGGGPYNLKLSQRRAEAVVADLIHRYHIAKSRLVPKGFGLTRPVASNATEGGKALNRRVELLRL